jgi:hypothetical protein
MGIGHGTIVIAIAVVGVGAVGWVINRWIARIHIGLIGLLLILLPVAYSAFLESSEKPTWVEVVMVVAGTFVLAADVAGKLPQRTLLSYIRRNRARER